MEDYVQEILNRFFFGFKNLKTRFLAALAIINLPKPFRVLAKNVTLIRKPTR